MIPRSIKRPRAVLAAAVVAAALAAPSAAGASTFCVGVKAPTCPTGGIQEGSNLQKALDDAITNTGADTVLVGDKGTPYEGPFAYEPLFQNPVTIEAAGNGRPALTAGGGSTVLTLDQATLRGIDVRISNPEDGLGIDMKNGRLQDVAVTSPAGPAKGGTGIRVTGKTTMQRTRVSSFGDVSVQVIGPALAGAGAELDGGAVTLQNAQVGLESDGGTVDLTSSRLSAEFTALRAGDPTTNGASPTTITRSTLVTTGPRSIGVDISDSPLTLDHVTVAQQGAGAADGTSALALRTGKVNGEATLGSIVLAGYARNFVRSVAAGRAFPVAVADSAWDASRDALGGATAGPFDESGNAHVAPALANLATGDLRPRGGSAAVDRDQLTAPARYVDIDDIATVDGDGDGVARPDAGALEYRRRAPQIDAVAVPSAGTTGAPLQFDASASDPDGDQVTLSWSFGDGSGANGGRTQHAYAGTGTFAVTLTATDEAGVTVTRSFTVAVAGAQPGAGGGPAGGSEGGGRAGGGAAGGPVVVPPARRDLRAPVLGKVRLSKTRVRTGKAKALRLRFSVDEGATLRIVAKRKVRGRVVTSARFVTRRVQAGRGTLAIASTLRRLKVLRPGSVSLVVTATDAAGNRSKARTVRLRLRP